MKLDGSTRMLLLLWKPSERLRPLLPMARRSNSKYVIFISFFIHHCWATTCPNFLKYDDIFHLNSDPNEQIFTCTTNWYFKTLAYLYVSFCFNLLMSCFCLLENQEPSHESCFQKDCCSPEGGPYIGTQIRFYHWVWEYTFRDPWNLLFVFLLKNSFGYIRSFFFILSL